MAHPVNWFQIGGPNGKLLHSFYKNVFGWKMDPAPGPGDMMMAKKEGDGIPGGIVTSMNGQPSVAVYVGVGDVDSHLGKVERAGGHMAMPKMELPGGMGFIAGFTDPAGNWIGLWAPAKKPAAATKRSARAVGAKKKTKASAAKKKPAAKAKKKR
ncbi:MAG TPA: hypothetical protein VIF62_24215 [Labilithrix sp.]|jgi:hypothetical protein